MYPLAASVVLMQPDMENAFICVREMTGSCTSAIWDKRSWNNPADSLITHTSCFYNHASEDICIAASPKGKMTRRAELPQHPHREAGYVGYTLPLLPEAVRVNTARQRTGRLKDNISDGCSLQRGTLGCSRGWKEFSYKLETFFSAKIWAAERRITFLLGFPSCCECKICSWVQICSHLNVL